MGSMWTWMMLSLVASVYASQPILNATLPSDWPIVSCPPHLLFPFPSLPSQKKDHARVALYVQEWPSDSAYLAVSGQVCALLFFSFCLFRFHGRLTGEE